MRPAKYRFGSYVLTGLTALQHWMRRRLATDCADPE